MTNEEALEALEVHLSLGHARKEREVTLLAIKALEKQIKYKWHRVEDEKPETNKMCLVKGHGSDFIKCQDGETIEQAVERVSQIEWQNVCFIDEEGFWDTSDGYPVMVQPDYWKYIDWE